MIEQLLGMIEIIKVEHHPMHIAAGHILVHTICHSILEIAGLAGVSADNKHHVRTYGHKLVPEILARSLRSNLITCVFGIFGGTLLQTAVSHGNKISLTYKKSNPLSRFPQNLIMNDIQVEGKVLFLHDLAGTTHPRNRQEEDSPKLLFTKSQLPRSHVVSAAESSVTSTGSVT